MDKLFQSIITASISVDTYLLCSLFALLCGVIVAAVSAYRSHATKSFIISLVLLPVIVETVIVIVNGNIGTGVAVMGAFSLIRFRSVPGKARDIASLFIAMTAGLTCATGYVGIAVLFTVLVSLIMLALTFIPAGNDAYMDLRITIPESLNFTDAFEDIFKKYTKDSKLTKTKTTNMGSLYKLTYKVKLKDKNSIKDFIDELRCRNGNLEIMISTSADQAEEL